MPKEFVLVHGAMHGAWCWEDVAARLAAEGHRVVVPERPGHGRRAALRAHVVGRGDGTFCHSAETAWARWMADLPRKDPRVARALSLLTPKAARPFFERVDLRRFDTLRIPCTYIRCLRDAAVIPPRAAATAARLGVKPVDMDSAHNPMLSKPDELVRLLTRIA
jgi:pimeloyl-ACP methyl ester carboxylesterase